jgi:hypothetical protein
VGGGAAPPTTLRGWRALQAAHPPSCLVDAERAACNMS